MNLKFEQGIKNLNLELTEIQKKQLQIYCGCVLEFNKTYNLMKAENEDELFVNHILDSISAVPHLTKIIENLKTQNNLEKLKIGDIGSGGGCPGLVLAAMFPNENFYLVERMEKRCAFLEDSIKKMSLQNTKVICSNADSVQKNFFNLEVLRAFHPFDKKIIKMLFAMLKNGGIIAAYKARLEKINAEMQEINFIVKNFKIIKLTVPFLEDHERNLVVIEKQPS